VFELDGFALSDDGEYYGDDSNYWTAESMRQLWEGLLANRNFDESKGAYTILDNAGVTKDKWDMHRTDEDDSLLTDNRHRWLGTAFDFPVFDDSLEQLEKYLVHAFELTNIDSDPEGKYSPADINLATTLLGQQKAITIQGRNALASRVRSHQETFFNKAYDRARDHAIHYAFRDIYRDFYNNLLT
jgi:hypothetical protein